VLTLLASCSKVPKPGNESGALADCAAAPATCNSGDRKPGGEITWVVEQGWGNQWNNMRPRRQLWHEGRHGDDSTPAAPSTPTSPPRAASPHRAVPATP
jgi:DNA-directed RNA polymerase specialized sigma24 family protein